MRFLYAGAANSTTNGVALGAAGQDVRVQKVFVGLPVNSGSVTLYNSAVAVGGASTNIAFKFTYDSSVDLDTCPRVFDFGAEGLQLDGGNLQIDQAMQVTVMWELLGE